MVGENESRRWEKWKEDLPKLSQLAVKRCVKPPDLKKLKFAVLHHFADASQFAFGAVSYLRMVDSTDNAYCSFLMGKSRVAHIRPMPRIILGLRKYDYISAGLRSLRWLNVKQRLMVNDAVMMHKCLKGLSPSYLSDKFSTRATIHERQTRNRDSLNIPPSRINAGQHAFYYRGVKVWNDLSKELQEITNTKVFKRRLINELICDMN